ncbi:hypothetical protein BS329_18845 [Amycolatopsis coloradensis]|uniref:Uncharacterized protein n=1 Tax=Amycolatopsis coloradensis TaxID=76021 RepID=A0A1R0KRR9_9PSEU|nr:hypothetical protein BS329_18845 [Amycolatopsis coloradensis]
MNASWSQQRERHQALLADDGGGQRLFIDGLPASKWTLTYQEADGLGEDGRWSATACADGSKVGDYHRRDAGGSRAIVVT